MAKPKQSDPTAERPASTPSFSDVTREIARRNEEAQKAARIRRTAREKEQIARRREWEQL
jgi:hypothetical protein